MTATERYGTRDLTYSDWHRAASIKRFLPVLQASVLNYIDIDACEYCHFCRETLALIETAIDIGQTNKATTVTRNLANKANVPAYLVYYTPIGGDVTRFRVKQVAPMFTDEKIMNPSEYAAFLWGLRIAHVCKDMRIQQIANRIAAAAQQEPLPIESVA